MYLLEMEIGSILLLIIAIAIALFINFLLIRGAVRSAVKDHQDNIDAFILLQLKRQGITTEDLENAKKYFRLLDKIDTYEKDSRPVYRKRLEDWWKGLKIGTSEKQIINQ